MICPKLEKWMYNHYTVDETAKRLLAVFNIFCLKNVTVIVLNAAYMKIDPQNYKQWEHALINLKYPESWDFYYYIKDPFYTAHQIFFSIIIL